MRIFADRFFIRAIYFNDKETIETDFAAAKTAAPTAENSITFQKF